MEKAIKRAIEGGYMVEESKLLQDIFGDKWLSRYTLYSCMLDPDFWKGLSKAEGWERLNPPTDKNIKTDEEYKYQMHRFVDHIIEGKSIDSFFEELLTNKD